METATTITKPTGQYVGDMPVIIDRDGEERLLFPSAQVLWNFQAGQDYRDNSHPTDEYQDLVYGERAYNHLRDEWGYDADTAFDWLAQGAFAFLTPENVIIWGAS